MLHEAVKKEWMCPMSKLTKKHTGKLFGTILSSPSPCLKLDEDSSCLPSVSSSAPKYDEPSLFNDLPYSRVDEPLFWEPKIDPPYTYRKPRKVATTQMEATKRFFCDPSDLPLDIYQLDREIILVVSQWSVPWVLTEDFWNFRYGSSRKKGELCIPSHKTTHASCSSTDYHTTLAIYLPSVLHILDDSWETLATTTSTCDCNKEGCSYLQESLTNLLGNVYIRERHDLWEWSIGQLGDKSMTTLSRRDWETKVRNQNDTWQNDTWCFDKVRRNST